MCVCVSDCSLRGGFYLSLTTVSPGTAAATDVIPFRLENLNSKVSSDEKQHVGDVFEGKKKYEVKHEIQMQRVKYAM